MRTGLLPRGIIKIDGLRTVANAEYVVAAGADLFGLVFAEARRKVDPRTAREIVDEVRALDGSGRLRALGVFVDQSADEINRIADAADLDLIQLHGEEPPELANAVERPVIRAFRSRPDLTVTMIDDYLEAMAKGRLAAAIIDGYDPTQPGGSGAGADWALASAVASRHPVLLAGGLTPKNVATAIKAVRPWGVDVSSGVEVDGRKDRDLMVSFVREARIAFVALS